MPEVLTPAAIRAIQTTFDNTFSTELEANAPSPFYNRAVTEINSTGAYEDFSWVTAFVAMREWIGEREIVDLAMFDRYLIQNRKFELTYETKIEDIEDGTWAFKQRLVAGEAADAYLRRKNQLIFDLLISAFGKEADPNDSATWFQEGTDLLGPDGVPFFSAVHPMGKKMTRVRANGTETYKFEQTADWSNVENVAFSSEALKDARKNMRRRKDHYGRPASTRANLLVVGPELEEAARLALAPNVKVETTVDGQTTTEERVQNTLAGAYELLVLDELDDSTAWFLMDTTRRVRPFIFTNRVAPQQQRVAAIDASAAEGIVSDYVFNHDAIPHGVRARFGGGYGNPVLGFASTGG